MLPVTAAKTQNDEQRHTRTKDKPETKKPYNYSKRRKLCANYNCYKIARTQGLCEQHFRECRRSQQPTVNSQVEDVFVNEPRNTRSKKLIYREEDDQINSDGKILYFNLLYILFTHR